MTEQLPDGLEIHRAGGAALAVRLRGLLGAAPAQKLFDAVIAERRWLVDASTEGSDDHRRAQLLYTPPDEAAEVVARIRARVPEVCSALALPPFEIGRVETQVTLHRDGDFYKRHADDGDPDVARRALSYVYYCHRLPVRFSGGELVLFDGDARCALAPEHDSAVIFPSSIAHEVTRVSVPSGELADGRISINGWLWRSRA